MQKVRYHSNRTLTAYKITNSNGRVNVLYVTTFPSQYSFTIANSTYSALEDGTPLFLQ